jgi:hypothetical protein
LQSITDQVSPLVSANLQKHTPNIEAWVSTTKETQGGFQETRMHHKEDPPKPCKREVHLLA